MKLLHTLGILWTLTRRDIIRAIKTLPDDILNQICDQGPFMLTFAYVMPQMGLPATYPIMMLASTMVSNALFMSWTTTGDLLGDITGEMKIGYKLRLPLPSWVIFAQVALGYAIRMFLVGLTVIPIGAAVLLGKLPLTVPGVGKMILLMIPNSLLFGFITIWVSARTKEMYKLSNSFIRFLIPCWMIIFFNPWSVLVQQIPAVGWAALASPITYSMEGMRAALLGQEGFLNYWLCFGMLCGFTVIIGWRAVVLMKRRLDFV